jgi:hypothetical protein
MSSTDLACATSLAGRRNECAALLDGLHIDVRLVLVHVGAEQPLPQPRRLHAGREGCSAISKTGFVENADVGFGEPGSLERLHRGVSVSKRIVDSD